MDLVAVIRHKVLTEGVPIREVVREFGLSRNTIRRYARAKAIPIEKPPALSRPAPARDEVKEAAEAIWKSRRSFTAGKQRLTATRLWELLRDAGHTASDRTVRRLGDCAPAIVAKVRESGHWAVCCELVPDRVLCVCLDVARTRIPAGALPRIHPDGDDVIGRNDIAEGVASRLRRSRAALTRTRSTTSRRSFSPGSKQRCAA